MIDAAADPRGWFITFEGPEGAGKSTQIQRLAAYLTGRGIKVCCTREPGGTPLAEYLRAVIKQYSGKEPVADLTELLLIEAARVQHVRDVIAPELNRGAWVLCDRYSDSTSAYQGGARGMDMQVVRQLNALAMGDCVPNLTFLLDLPVETGFERTGKRVETQGETDRFEQESRAFHERVRQTYLRLAAQDSRRIKVIDAAQSAEMVFQAIVQVVDALF